MFNAYRVKFRGVGFKMALSQLAVEMAIFNKIIILIHCLIMIFYYKKCFQHITTTEPLRW